MNFSTFVRSVAGLLLAGSALGAQAQGSFYGYAYDLETGKYLYTEVHQPVIEAGSSIDVGCEKPSDKVTILPFTSAR